MRKSILAAGLGLLLAGCESMQEAGPRIAGTVLLGNSAANPNLTDKQRAVAYVVGDDLQKHSVADTGRDQIYIDRQASGNATPQLISSGRKKSFGVYNWVDINRDGFWGGEAEGSSITMKGKENTVVSRRENFLVLGLYESCVLSQSTLTVYDPNGGKIFYETKKINSSPFAHAFPFTAGTARAGNYTAVFEKTVSELQKETHVLPFTVAE